MVKPIPSHKGTSCRYMLFKESELPGTHFVDEFSVSKKLEPHKHDFEEFYYVLHGRGVMTVGNEERDVFPGDLIFIPPNVMHSIRAKTPNYPVHQLCWAVKVK